MPHGMRAPAPRGLDPESELSLSHHTGKEDALPSGRAVTLASSDERSRRRQRSSPGDLIYVKGNCERLC